jgi:peptidoglycan hydrolase-like protein with peptidoglycan-binding domain
VSLQSRAFRTDVKLQTCAVSDPAHITEGAAGEHVGKIQQALALLDGAKIEPGERATKRYGPSTAAAVLAYKTKRNIINRAYQVKPDDIVGKMTIVALDQEMFRLEQPSAYNSCAGKRSSPR